MAASLPHRERVPGRVQDGDQTHDRNGQADGFACLRDIQREQEGRGRLPPVQAAAASARLTNWLKVPEAGRRCGGRDAKRTPERNWRI